MLTTEVIQLQNEKPTTEHSDHPTNEHVLTHRELMTSTRWPAPGATSG